MPDMALPEMTIDSLVPWELAKLYIIHLHI